jgi:hypothetical protein
LSRASYFSHSPIGNSIKPLAGKAKQSQTTKPFIFQLVGTLSPIRNISIPTAENPKKLFFKKNK